MTPTPQPELALSAARVRRPMVDNAGARAMLDAEDWQLATLVDQGLIRGVLNVASPDAQRRALRFAVVALEEYRRGQGTGSPVPERTAAELAVLIFGQPQEEVPARWIYRALSCKPSHFYNLVDERVIKLARGSGPRCGPGGSAVVEWGELERFIQTRRVD